MTDINYNSKIGALLQQVIYGDFSGDNPQDLNLALAARAEYIELLKQRTNQVVEPNCSTSSIKE